MPREIAMKRFIELLPAMLLSLISTVTVHAAPQSAEEELALASGDKYFATIAAADLDEVLETVPGLHVARSPLGYNPIYTIRGISTQYNPQVLMLVNGIPITGVTFGDRSIIWGGMPVENIARIEVIRGPGSALYGADAFSGVINIITKTAADINSTQAGLRAGSGNSRDAGGQHGGAWGSFDAAAYLRVGHTDGQHQIIAADAQSF